MKMKFDEYTAIFMLVMLSFSILYRIHGYSTTEIIGYWIIGLILLAIVVITRIIETIDKTAT